VHWQVLLIIISGINRRQPHLYSSSAREDGLNDPGEMIRKWRFSGVCFWAVKVSGNWRVIFQFKEGDAYLVDYIDYHLKRSGDERSIGNENPGASG
jgi:RelE-like toxin of type II toxin-antitoxin system HigB